VRFVAFPAAISRLPLDLPALSSEIPNWTTIGKPTSSGLYLLEATSQAIHQLREVFDGHYLFMEDF